MKKSRWPQALLCCAIAAVFSVAAWDKWGTVDGSYIKSGFWIASWFAIYLTIRGILEQRRKHPAPPPRASLDSTPP